MTRAELEREFRAILSPHYPRHLPQRLVEDLIGVASAYAAGQIEKACRPYPWPPPRRPRLDEAKAAGRQQPETRRSA